MGIHFFSAKRVAQELRAGLISPNRAFWYFGAWLVFQEAVLGYSIYLMGPPDTLTIIQGIASVAVIAIGLYQCYSANGGNEGRELLVRFGSLALPISVTLQIGYELVYWTMYYAYPVLTQGLSDADYQTVWHRAFVVAWVGLMVIWYWRMAFWLRFVSAPQSA